jgi:hypothetical protein
MQISNFYKKRFFSFFFLLDTEKFFIVNNFFFVTIFYIHLYKFLKYFLIINNLYIYTFLTNIYLFSFFNKILLNIFLKSIYLFCGFIYFHFYYKIGLGFRKKFSKIKKHFMIYVGGRHWAIFKSNFNDFHFNIRHKNILIFTQTKNSMNYYKSLIKCLRKESVFKIKGFFFKRIRIRKKIPRSIIFARRIKFSSVKLKLSKKQKLI